MVWAQFIEDGYFERHIAKMKKIYRKRQETIIKALGAFFPGKFKVSGHSTGLHLIVEFNDLLFTGQVLEQLEEEGVRVYPAEMYAVNKGRYQNRIMLGYGNVNEEKIMEGINKMKSVLSNCRE